MKKKYLLPIIMAFVLLMVNKAFSQFQGMIEIKETVYQQKPSDQNKMQDVIPAEAKKEIMEQIEKKENELKNKQKSDEDYQNLVDEIKMMKDQVGLSSNNSYESEVQFMNMYFLNDDVRTETITGKTQKEVAIIKVKEKKIIILMDEEKQYLEVDFNIINQMAKEISRKKLDIQVENEKSDNITGNVKKTGKSQIILGYKCDEYLLEQDDMISTVYIYPNFNGFWKIFNDIVKSFDANNKKEFNNWYLDILGENGFPFKEIEKNKAGEIVSEMEVTKVDKSKPSSILFAPPEGYKRVSLEDLFNVK